MLIDETFESKIREIDNLILNLKDPENKSSPILDGIVDNEQYSKQDLKILWILKEVNSEDDNDHWDLRGKIADLKESNGISKGWAGTFNPIVYATCGILDDKLWEDIPNTDAKLGIIDVLKKIAYINVKKIPGSANANHLNIQNSYSVQKDILIKQIELFEPNIIICGGTYCYIKDDLGIENYEEKQHFPRNIYLNPTRLIIDTYHPNNRTINQETYCNNIHNAFKIWQNEFRNKL